MLTTPHEDETTETVVEEIGCLQRAAPSIETLGIRLDEGKAILANLQESVVAHQVAEHMKKGGRTHVGLGEKAR